MEEVKTSSSRTEKALSEALSLMKEYSRSVEQIKEPIIKQSKLPDTSKVPFHIKGKQDPRKRGSLNLSSS